jgi:hypothetical protein
VAVAETVITVIQLSQKAALVAEALVETGLEVSRAQVKLIQAAVAVLEVELPRHLLCPEDQVW